jgi:hypothetical protein
MFFLKKTGNILPEKPKKRKSIYLNFEGDPGMARIKYDREGGDHRCPVPDNTIILAVQEFEASG